MSFKEPNIINNDEVLDFKTFDIISFGMTLEDYKDQLLLQINNKHTQTRDFLSIILNKYDVVLNPNYLIDDKHDLKEQKEGMLSDILNAIEAEYNIDVDLNLISLEDAVTELYRYTIQYYINSVTSFIIEYILSNQKTILDSIGKSDNITKNILKQYDNHPLCIVMINIISVINDILHNTNFTHDYIFSHIGISNELSNAIYSSDEFDDYFFAPIKDLKRAGSTIIIGNISDELLSIINTDLGRNLENE